MYPIKILINRTQMALSSHIAFIISLFVFVHYRLISQRTTEILEHSYYWNQLDIYIYKLLYMKKILETNACKMGSEIYSE